MTKLLELFRSGMDTLAISEHLGGAEAGWPESRVYRVLGAERREERSVQVTWDDVRPRERKNAPTAKARKTIAYVGYNGREEWND